MEQRRVVISGIGVVLGLGSGVGARWEGLLAGRSAGGWEVAGGPAGLGRGDGLFVLPGLEGLNPQNLK